MPESTKPVLFALLLADHVYQDEGTKKHVIAGTFNRLWFPEFPATPPEVVSLYAALRNIHGRVDLTMRLIDLKENAVLTESGFHVESKGPLDLNEVVLRIGPGVLVFPHDGVFSLEVHFGAEMLSSVRLHVDRIPPGQIG